MANEKEKIISDFAKVITYSQKIDNPEVEGLIEESFRAKDFFIQLFGNKLIYEYPEEVSFEYSESEKLSRVVDLCEKFENRFNAWELSEFIYAQRNSFFSNRVSEQYVTRSGTIIQKGTKLLKAFKYFDDNPNTVRKLQDIASLVIQEDKVTGKLCFSVHPLDFLSSSENVHNWRSCHALDGDFKAGNLSYMLDSCTFMCYLKSDTKAILPNFPSDVLWNSKKWRTLMFLSDNKDMMFAGRQYPFSTENGIEYVKGIFEKCFPILDQWTPWQKNKIKTFNEGETIVPLQSSYIGVGNQLISMRKLIQDEGTPYPLHFNDLLKSSCYDPLYSYKMKSTYSYHLNTNVQSISTLGSSRFKIGGKVKCLCCGQGYVEMPELMTCTECEIKYGYGDSDSFGYCPCCDRRFVYDDGYYVDIPGETVCPDCWINYIVSCDICGESAYTDGNDITYDSKSERYICRYCKGD